MFTSQERLKRRTGKNKLDRFAYLSQLKSEYEKANNKAAQHQVLANLANFAYDPINYEFIRKLGIIDLFIRELENSDETIVEYSIAGLCNLCLDFDNKDHIIDTQGAIRAIKNCLHSTNESTSLNALTTLIYLITPKSKQAITTQDTVETIVAFSKNPNTRFKNLARIFLDDYCTREQIEKGEKSLEAIISQYV